jgi:hypothetical protein
MGNRFFYSILLFLITIAGSANSVDSLLLVLDATIQRGSEYTQIREDRINGLKSMLVDLKVDSEQQYFIYSRLYSEYRAYQFDSAFHYLSLKTNLAHKLEKDEWINESLIQQMRLFTETGMFKEAFDIHEKLSHSKISKNELGHYFSISAQLFSQHAFYTNVPSDVQFYREMERSYRDSALATLPQGSQNYKKELEIYYYGNGRIVEAKQVALSLLEQTEINNPLYAFFAYRVARNYAALGNKEKEKEYLIRSAISDIQNGIKDNASLTMLAMMLYGEKKIDKAYEHIQFSLADASFFNAPLRIIELSNVLPVINDAYNLKLEKQKNELERYLLLISFLTIFLITSLFFIFKQLKKISRVKSELQVANNRFSELNKDLSTANNKLNKLNTQLSESNHIKEQYIGLFLNRCSEYIDKLKDYQKYVNKQISLHKIPELFDSTKSSKLIDNELKEFYDTFDKTFLILFPNFVEKINELLVDEERIELREGELLNTELRIFALIKLGITDSSKIASLLRYSVHTIYNYRVKIKNKSSVPRDQFEEMVKNI